MRDNVRTRILRPDGTYARSEASGEAAHRSQYELLERAAARDEVLPDVAREPLSFDSIAGLADGNGDSLRSGGKKKKKSAVR